MAKKKKKTKKIVINLKCPFNGDPSKINYKDVYTLKKYVTTRGRILQSERTGVSQNCQRKLRVAIKRARYMALLPTNELT
jgi:small subunit ribosomal protein S18